MNRLPGNYRVRESGLYVPEAGVIIPMSAMPGPDHQGTPGSDAEAMISRVARAGFGNVHDLPFTPPDAYNCPYSSGSTFAVDPQRIDLERLVESGDLTDREFKVYLQEVAMLGFGQQKVVSYEAKDTIKSQKEDLLRRASRNFDNSADLARKETFANWCSQESEWLDTYAAFEILKKLPGNVGKRWQDWETGKNFSPKLVADIKATYGQEFSAICYMQWVAEEQTIHYVEFAKTLGVKIWGDIPFYTGDCDVWANRNVFNLDSEGNQLTQGGAPPSDTAKDGQLWGNATYKVTPETIDWWVKRLKRVVKLNGGKIRLDHFIAFAEPYISAANATDGKEGWREEGMGQLLFDKLFEAFNVDLSRHFYPEDLGEKTHLTTDLRDDNGLESSKVVARGLTKPKTFEEYLKSENHPDNLGPKDIALFTTHDSPTFVEAMLYARTNRPEVFTAFVESLSQRYPDRGLSVNTNLEELARAEMERLMHSLARVAFVGVWDLSKRGRRYNKPGSVSPNNWSQRMDSVYVQDVENQVPGLYELNKATGRLPQDVN